MEQKTSDTTVVGEAQAMKIGPLVLTETGERIMIRGLEFWPDEAFGKKVEVSGSMSYEKVLSKAVEEEGEPMSQGGSEDWYANVIQIRSWKILEE